MNEDEFRKQDTVAANLPPPLAPIHASYEIAGTCHGLLKQIEALPIADKESKQTKELLATGVRLVAGLLFNIAVIAEHSQYPFRPVLSTDKQEPTF